MDRFRPQVEGLPDRLNPGDLSLSGVSDVAGVISTDYGNYNSLAFVGGGEEYVDFTDSSESGPWSGPGVTGVAFVIDFDRLNAGGLLKCNQPVLFPAEPRAGEYSCTLSFTLWRTTWGVPVERLDVSVTCAGRAGIGGVGIQALLGGWTTKLAEFGLASVGNGVDGKVTVAGTGTDGAGHSYFVTGATMTMAYGFGLGGPINPLAQITPTVSVLP